MLIVNIDSELEYAASRWRHTPEIEIRKPVERPVGVPQPTGGGGVGSRPPPSAPLESPQIQLEKATLEPPL